MHKPRRTPCRLAMARKYFGRGHAVTPRESVNASRVSPDRIGVLIVDDSRATQAIIRRAVQDAHLGEVDVQVVDDGEQALAAIESFAPRLVISDLHMPRMSGLELLRVLRRGPHHGLAFGVVTTEADPELLAQARRNGASFVIRKPFRDEDLVAQVRRALATSGESLAPAACPSRCSIHDLLLGHFVGRSVRIVEGDAFDASHLSAQNLLALYKRAPSPRICAIAIANMQAICMLGGATVPMPGDLAGGALDGGVISQAVVRRATAFFGQAALCVPTLFPDLTEVEFKGANLMPREFAKLKTALESVKDRCDYRVAFAAEPGGRFVFLRT